ncbi:hypothetical protein BN1708_017647, partial [Verticillium longisporum]
AEAERAAREKMEAERKHEAEQAKLHAETMARIQREAKEKYEAEMKAAAEQKKREDDARAAAEAAARAKFEAQLKAEAEAKLAADKKAAEDAEAKKKILDMCAQNNYANLVDFDWYIDVLTQLVRMAPAPRSVGTELESASSYGSSTSGDIAEKIGDELRNVSVKVMAMRRSVVMAADLILTQLNADTPPGHFITSASIKSIAWIIGEYPIMLSSTDDSLTTLLQTIPR